MKLNIPASIKTIEDVNKVGNIAINYMKKEYQLEEDMVEYLVGLIEHNRTYWMECLLKQCKNQYQFFAEMFKIMQESLLGRYPSKLTDVLFGPVCVPGPEENTVVPIGEEELDSLWKEGKQSICGLYQLTEEQLNRLEEIYTNSKEYILKQSQDCYDIGRVFSNMCTHCLDRLAEIYPEITNKITRKRVSEELRRKAKMEDKKEALVLTEDEAIGITLSINKAPEDKKIETIYRCVEDVIKRRWNITDNKSLDALLYKLTRIDPCSKEAENEILTNIANNGIPLTVEMVANKVCDSLGLTSENSNFKEVIREKYGESGVSINSDPVKFLAHKAEVECASLLNQLTNNGSITNQEASMLATIFRETKGASNIANNYLQIRTPGDSHFQDGITNLTLTWINNEIRNLRRQNANEILNSFNQLNGNTGLPRVQHQCAGQGDIPSIVQPYIDDIVNTAAAQTPVLTTVKQNPDGSTIFHASMHTKYNYEGLPGIDGTLSVCQLLYACGNILFDIKKNNRGCNLNYAHSNGEIIPHPYENNIIGFTIFNNLTFNTSVIDSICHGLCLALAKTTSTRTCQKTSTAGMNQLVVTYNLETKTAELSYEIDFIATPRMFNDAIVKEVVSQIESTQTNNEPAV